MIKRKGLFIGLGVLVILTGIGLSFINYRKRKIKRKAYLFEGIKEVGNNAGFNNETFEKMMREIGWKGGEQWCMYFAKNVYVQSLPKLSEHFKKVLSGSTQGSFNKIENGDSEYLEVVKEGSPKIGDIVIWQRQTDKSKGHAGIVIDVSDGGKKFKAMEGNTNFDPEFGGDGQLVDIVPHETNYGSSDSTYKRMNLRGFIRLK